MRIRSHTTTALACLALMSAAAGPAFPGDLTVVRAVWTTRVSDRQPVDTVRPGARAGSIYFWTQLQGGREALDELARAGKLPIYHQWIESSSLGAKPIAMIDPEQEGSRSLPAGAISGSDGLVAMVDEQSRFRWRTWSNKRGIWPGTWVVIVRYADGTPVMCGGEPCRSSIRLR